MATTVYGGTVKGYWQTYLTYTLNNSYSNTQASIAWAYGIHWVAQIKGDGDTNGNYMTEYDRPTYVSCTGQTTQNKYPTAKLTKTWYNNGNRNYQYGSGTFYINKKTSSQSVTLTASITHSTSMTTYSGTSSKSVSLTISALPSYTISFNANAGGDTVSNMPSSKTKYYGVNITLPSNVPTRNYWEFGGWNTNSGGTGTLYQPGATYTGNATATLYAKWNYVSPFVNNVKVTRCDANLDEDDEANYVCIEFDYSSGHTPSGSPVTTTVTASIGGSSLTLYSGTNTFTGTGTGKKLYYYAPTSTYPTDTTYTITLSLAETGHTAVTGNVSLYAAIYPIDLAADGSLISHGVPLNCRDELYLDIDKNAAAGTIDGDLMAALAALGWDDTIANGGVFTE